jgi:hypothetical protein
MKTFSETDMRSTSLAVVLAAVVLGLAGCSYTYQNPAEGLAPGEVGGRTVAGVDVLADGVAVAVKGAALDASSRQNGRFAMLPLPVGRHTLMFRKGKERALQRDVEISWGKDGQPAGIWMGDVTVPVSAGLYGECAGPPGVLLADNGVALDEVSGAIVPLHGGSYGDFTFEGLSVGDHRVRIFVTDSLGGRYVGGPVSVTLLPSDSGTVKAMTRFPLRAASTDPATTATVKFRFSVAGSVSGLQLGSLTVTGLPVPVTFQSDGSAQVDLPEGLWTLGITLPGAAAATAPPLVTFVALADAVIDLGTLYAVSDAAQAQASLACHADADCAPSGTCVQGLCQGWAPSPAAPASLPPCDLEQLGCAVGAPLGGVWNGATSSYDPPYTMTCAADVAGTWAVGVACGSCCTPDGLATVCGAAGVGGCPGLSTP